MDGISYTHAHSNGCARFHPERFPARIGRMVVARLGHASFCGVGEPRAVASGDGTASGSFGACARAPLILPHGEPQPSPQRRRPCASSGHRPFLRPGQEQHWCRDPVWRRAASNRLATTRSNPTVLPRFARFSVTGRSRPTGSAGFARSSPPLRFDWVPVHRMNRCNLSSSNLNTHWVDCP